MDAESSKSVGKPGTVLTGAASPAKAGWTKPRPQNMPSPTYAPAVIALAMVCLLWGLVTTYLISLLGLALLVVGVVNWIGGFRHEHGYP